MGGFVIFRRAIAFTPVNSAIPQIYSTARYNISSNLIKSGQLTLLACHLTG